MAADQTKDVQFDIKNASGARTGHEIAARHRHRPRKHVEPTMLARIGRSMKEALIKTEALFIPHPGKDRKVWD
jgi:hypothetical protein